MMSGAAPPASIVRILVSYSAPVPGVGWMATFWPVFVSNSWITRSSGVPLNSSQLTKVTSPAFAAGAGLAAVVAAAGAVVGAAAAGFVGSAGLAAGAVVA